MGRGVEGLSVQVWPTSTAESRQMALLFKNLSLKPVVLTLEHVAESLAGRVSLESESVGL